MNCMTFWIPSPAPTWKNFTASRRYVCNVTMWSLNDYSPKPALHFKDYLHYSQKPISCPNSCLLHSPFIHTSSWCSSSYCCPFPPPKLGKKGHTWPKREEYGCVQVSIYSEHCTEWVPLTDRCIYKVCPSVRTMGHYTSSGASILCCCI